MSAPVIAIDAMGGDFGPHCIVPACISALAEYPSLHLALRIARYFDVPVESVFSLEEFPRLT